MHYTNTSNISLALAVFLATDDYDHEPNTISATSLMKSTRQHILSKRIPAEENFIDISTLVPSKLGSAIHGGIENAWLNPDVSKIIEALGYPKAVHENIKVNPSPEEITDKTIAIYMEIRSYLDVLGVKVSGKFDFVGDGQVQDFKNTSVWRYIYQTSKQDYINQLSIYKLLNPDIITKDTGLIHYIFSDWSKMASLQTKNYPPSRVFTQKITLMTNEQTLAYVKNKISLILRHQNTPEHELPLCTDEELWRKDPLWKYYKNPQKTDGRSTKNFDNLRDATIKLVEDGSVGIVKHVPGQVVACLYCSAFSRCTQAKSLIANGELTL